MENYDIIEKKRKFDNDERFIQTSTAILGQMICGHWRERTGLKRKHMKRAIEVLSRQNFAFKEKEVSR